MKTRLGEFNVPYGLISAGVLYFIWKRILGEAQMAAAVRRAPAMGEGRKAPLPIRESPSRYAAIVTGRLLHGCGGIGPTAATTRLLSSVAEAILPATSRFDRAAYRIGEEAVFMRRMVQPVDHGVVGCQCAAEPDMWL